MALRRTQSDGSNGEARDRRPGKLRGDAEP